MPPTRESISRNLMQMSKGQRSKELGNLQNVLLPGRMDVGLKNVSGVTVNRTTDEYLSVDEYNFIYTGIPNETATKLVLILMGFIISLIFLCIFLITAVYIYYKERTDDIFTATEENAKIDKANSPYIVTPEQKITQQFLSAEIVTPVECSAKDIARLLRYMALYGEFTEDDIYRTPQSFIRLVTRAKTKFDESVSKNEQEMTSKFSSKTDLRSDKQTSTTTTKSRKDMQQQHISSSKPRKKARRKQLSDEMDNGSGAKRNSRKGSAVKKRRKVKDGEKINSKSKLSRQLAETSPRAHERLLRKWKKRKHLKESKRYRK